MLGRNKTSTRTHETAGSDPERAGVHVQPRTETRKRAGERGRKTNPHDPVTSTKRRARPIPRTNGSQGWIQGKGSAPKQREKEKKTRTHTRTHTGKQETVGSERTNERMGVGRRQGRPSEPEESESQREKEKKWNGRRVRGVPLETDPKHPEGNQTNERIAHWTERFDPRGLGRWKLTADASRRNGTDAPTHNERPTFRDRARKHRWPTSMIRKSGTSTTDKDTP